VIRRCPAPLTMMVAALAMSLGSRPMSTQADTIVTYTPLTSSAGIPIPGTNLAAPQVEYLVTPPGGVDPPVSSTGAQESPLTINAGSTGFDESQLVVALKSTTSSTGAPEQILGLVFFGQGLAAGGVLNFSLSTATGSTPPELTLVGPNTYGLPLTLDPVTNASPDGSGGGNGGISNNAPEPLSLVIWSALACAGLWRARAQRRSQPVAR
jgi:hypothetical protein